MDIGLSREFLILIQAAQTLTVIRPWDSLVCCHLPADVGLSCC